MVLEGGLNPEYVLDKMQFYEIKPLFNQLHKKNRDTYEAARMLALVYAQSNTKKRLKATDIFTFPWDDENKGKNTGITNDDIVRLKEKAKQQEKKLNNGKSNNAPNS